MAIYRSGSTEVSHKADASLVTEADLAAHGVLADQLANLLPSCHVVSEEEPISLVYRQSAGRFKLVRAE
jgi:3'(2'), 5'-bisphosphate nucleotidase